MLRLFGSSRHQPHRVECFANGWACTSTRRGLTGSTGTRSLPWSKIRSGTLHRPRSSTNSTEHRRFDGLAHNCLGLGWVTFQRNTGEMEEVLKGGVANAGAVTRVGEHILRPANAHTPTIHRFLRQLADEGFAGAPLPVGVDQDGRERLRFVFGEVALPPYPVWARSDEALASIARLLSRFHRAARTFPERASDTWSDEMADPVGGSVVCHNDVCLENVVFRHGEAVALLDFDFAAPGRPAYDVACFARMCVPIDDDENRARFGWQGEDLPARLRLVAEEYGLDLEERSAVVAALDASIARGGEFVRRRVEAGDQNFAAMWAEMGGMTRFDRRRTWWNLSRPNFVAAMS